MSPYSDAWSRFESKFEIDDTGCWIWNAAIGAGGYGSFRSETINWKAHRFAYEQLVGPVPNGLQLDHLCRVRRCVNPAHLEPVTPQVNTKRGYDARRPVEGTLCREGLHRISGENVSVDVRGKTRCKACNNAKNAERNRARRRAATASAP